MELDPRTLHGKFHQKFLFSISITSLRCYVSLWNSQNIIIYFKISADMAKEEGTNLNVIER